MQTTDQPKLVAGLTAVFIAVGLLAGWDLVHTQKKEIDGLPKIDPGTVTTLANEHCRPRDSGVTIAVNYEGRRRGLTCP